MSGPRDMADRDTALECLRLANRDAASPDEVVERAQAYFDFVTGTDGLAKKMEAIRGILG